MTEVVLFDVGERKIEGVEGREGRKFYRFFQKVNPFGFRMTSDSVSFFTVKKLVDTVDKSES